ncbi:MAG: TPM domain-containing protein [Ignavibacteriaceae bacterium]
MKYIYLFLFCSILGYSVLGYSEPKIPQLQNWATDLTNTLTTEQLSTLDYGLRTFEDSTSNQIAILMINTLDNYPLEEYSYDVAHQNKIGTKKLDNGILLLIVKGDKKARIEVGYGLEGALPDALASSIIRNVMFPYFKKEEYYGGITAGLNAIISAVKGEYKAEYKPDKKDKGLPNLLPFIIIIFFLIRFLFRGGRRGGGGFIFFPGGFGGGSSGGSFGGGGFSGGGGSFGGGGASGSW